MSYQSLADIRKALNLNMQEKDIITALSQLHGDILSQLFVAAFREMKNDVGKQVADACEKIRQEGKLISGSYGRKGPSKDELKSYIQDAVNKIIKIKFSLANEADIALLVCLSKAINLSNERKDAKSSLISRNARSIRVGGNRQQLFQSTYDAIMVLEKDFHAEKIAARKSVSTVVTPVRAESKLTNTTVPEKELNNAAISQLSESNEKRGERTITDYKAILREPQKHPGLTPLSSQLTPNEKENSKKVFKLKVHDKLYALYKFIEKNDTQSNQYSTFFGYGSSNVAMAKKIRSHILTIYYQIENADEKKLAVLETLYSNILSEPYLSNKDSIKGKELQKILNPDYNQAAGPGEELFRRNK